MRTDREAPRPDALAAAQSLRQARILLGGDASALNYDCVLVGIARDVLDVRQAFTAGVHFLIHKPASVVQIERCLRTAYLASVARRRRPYRAAVEIASIATRNHPDMRGRIVNLGEGGAGVHIPTQSKYCPSPLSVGEFVVVTCRLPGSHAQLQIMRRLA